MTRLDKLRGPIIASQAEDFPAFWCVRSAMILPSLVVFVFVFDVVFVVFVASVVVSVVRVNHFFR